MTARVMAARMVTIWPAAPAGAAAAGRAGGGAASCRQSHAAIPFALITARPWRKPSPRWPSAAARACSYAWMTTAPAEQAGSSWPGPRSGDRGTGDMATSAAGFGSFGSVPVPAQGLLDRPGVHPHAEFRLDRPGQVRRAQARAGRQLILGPGQHLGGELVTAPPSRPRRDHGIPPHAHPGVFHPASAAAIPGAGRPQDTAAPEPGISPLTLPAYSA